MWGPSGSVQLPDVQDTKIAVGSFELAFKPPICFLCHRLHANAEIVPEHSHDNFLPNDYKFIFLPSFFYLML